MILFGSEGTAKVFSSEVAFEGMDEQNIGKTNLPTAVVEAVDPIVLNMSWWTSVSAAPATVN